MTGFPVRPRAGIADTGYRFGFTLIELMVVIGIIGVLMALLIPTLSKARDQAGYIRWQAFQHGAANDPDIAACWPLLENDYMTLNLTNTGAINIDADALKGTIAYTLHPTMNEYKQAWFKGIAPGGVAVSRWNLKPALNGSVSVGFETTQIALAKLLGERQQITISCWVFQPSTASSTQIMSWADAAGTSRLRFGFFHGLAYCDNGDGATLGNYNGSAVDRIRQTYPPQGQTETLWQNWVFTKDATTGNGHYVLKMYYNGILMSQATDGSSPILMSSASPNALHTEPWNVYLSFAPSLKLGSGITFDDLTVYSRVLSDGEVFAIYKAGSWQ